MEARFLLLSDVAAELNVSDSQVYHMVRSGELPAIKIGGRGQWRVERARLEEYIEQQVRRDGRLGAEKPARSTATPLASAACAVDFISRWPGIDGRLTSAWTDYAVEGKRRQTQDWRSCGRCRLSTCRPSVIRPADPRAAGAPLDPPFDDEVAPRSGCGPAHDQLAVRLRSAAPAPGRAPVASPDAVPAGSPEGRRAARSLRGACLEMLNGYRPAAHLRPLTRRPTPTGSAERLRRDGRPLPRPTTGPCGAARAGGAPVRCACRAVRACSTATGRARPDRRTWAMPRLEAAARWLAPPCRLI